MADRDSWKSLLPDDDPLYVSAPSPSPSRPSVASTTDALSSLSIASHDLDHHDHCDRRLSGLSQLSNQTAFSAAIPPTSVLPGSLSHPPSASVPAHADPRTATLTPPAPPVTREEENLDQASSRSAPPNLSARERALSPSSFRGEYARARQRGHAGTPDLSATRSTRSWNGQSGEPDYLVQHSPVPTTPFLEQRPAPPETNLTVDTHDCGWTIRLHLPGFAIEGLTLSVKARRTVHIVADKWDSDSGGHFERRVLFGPDADMRHVRAQFDGACLLVHVPLRQRRQHPRTSSPRRSSAASEQTSVSSRSHTPAIDGTPAKPTAAAPAVPTVAAPATATMATEATSDHGLG